MAASDIKLEEQNKAAAAVPEEEETPWSSDKLVAPPPPDWLTEKMKRLTLIIGTVALVVSTFIIGVNSGMESADVSPAARGVINIVGGIIMFSGMAFMNIALMAGHHHKAAS